MTWLNEASGEDGSGWTANRSYTIRTSRRGVYKVRVTAALRGGAGEGGVVTNIKDSGIEVVVHAGTLIRMCVLAKSAMNSSFISYSVRLSHSSRNRGSNLFWKTILCWLFP